ncbi:MAG: FkbM family methyltransferase [bacterium]
MKKLSRIIELIFIWIFTPNISIKNKANYLIYFPITLLRLIFNREKRLSYFSRNFNYDDLSDVFTILAYPFEVTNRILDFIKPEEVKNVLDIGANLGQFSITISNLLNNKPKIYSFEPNNEIYTILEKNTKRYTNIHIYNLGVGEKGEKTFYFTKNKSAKGSLIKENAKIKGSDSLIKTSIKLTSDIVKTTERSNFDLIKIDVEGYEFEVIKNLNHISCQYLLVEVSCGTRTRSYLHSDFLKLLESKFGKFDILFQSEVKEKAECYDCLFKFMKI